jgi:ubiquinone/menaquinone biosynthesis C-methylase UbiE
MDDTQELLTRTVATYEKIAQEYCNYHFNIEEIKLLANFFIQHLPGKKVLDVGCGPGRDSLYFSNHNLDVIGIDMASNFIKLASKQVNNAKFIQMDMRNLTFEEDFFDGLWVCASFLHIPKQEAKTTLTQFRKVLKSNGLIYISVKMGVEEKMLVNNKYKKERFFAFYTKEELENVIISCGFQILKVEVDQGKDNWIDLFAYKK